MITATAQTETKAKDSLTGRSLLAQIKCNIEWMAERSKMPKQFQRRLTAAPFKKSQ